MTSNIEKFKLDISNLIDEGQTIYKKIKDNEGLLKSKQDYEIWYSEAISAIKVILPNRINDFILMYYNDKTKTGLKLSFQHIPPKIEKGLYFESFDDKIIYPENYKIAKSIFESQIGILKACERRFESSLFDIKQILQSDIFENELETAHELNKKGFLRGAGAIAGVVLEGHLKQVCENHKLTQRKSHPTINDCNQILKDNEIIDVPTWRFIQHLGDIRNLCDHKKENEPTKENIDELIKGVEKITKTVY
jgi:hypothetical protein